MATALSTSDTGTRRSAARKRLGFSAASLAWALALITVGLLVLWLGYTFWNGYLDVSELVYVSQILNALVGALIVSRQPRNSVGWLLILFALAIGASTLLAEYGTTVLTSHSSLPLVTIALWIYSWFWILPFGLAFATIVLRFPDGRVPHRWRFVDLLAVAGTAFFAVAIALTPGPLFRSGGIEVDNPFGLMAPSRHVVMYGLGIALIGASALTAVASLVARYRRADREQRLKLKWVLFASGIVMATVVYAAVVEVAFRAERSAALTPFAVTLSLIPLATGVAILRHRLFDIDVIISRTLVYAILTAILGGIYVGGIELIQQLFVFYTGEKSNTAVVITAFVVAGAFTPVQKWSEKVVEQRLGSGRDPASKLDAFTSSIEAVVRVIDPHRVARHLVDESVGVFEAVGGALYLDSYGQTQPFHSAGTVDGDCAVEVAVRHAERSLGRLLLGHRRGGAVYSERDRKALQRSADAVGQAIGVGTELGLIPPPKPRLEAVSAGA